MSTCVVCQEQNAQFLCSHKCHTAYCSPICAKADWNQHYAMCGDYLDTLPKEALVVVLANMSFEDVYSSALISKRFAYVINTYSFRKAFALKHKGEWEYIIHSWLMKRSYNKLEIWIQVLLETNAWNPTLFGNFAIKDASTHGYTEIVKIITC